MRSPRPRRQRTTSINQSTTVTSNESIIRANNRTIYTAGRPPWYDCAGQQVEPFVIGKNIGQIKSIPHTPHTVDDDVGNRERGRESIEID